MLVLLGYVADAPEDISGHDLDGFMADVGDGRS